MVQVPEFVPAPDEVARDTVTTTGEVKKNWIGTRISDAHDHGEWCVIADRRRRIRQKSQLRSIGQNFVD
jgi:hypothetical protein